MPSLGSRGITRSATAPRRTARTLLVRVCTVPGAKPRETMLLTQCSRCERRRVRICTSAKVVDRAARLIAVSVPGAHTWRVDHSA